MFSYEEIDLSIKALCIFRNLTKDKVIQTFTEMLNSKNESELVEKYAKFTNLLFQNSENFTDYVWKLIISDENFYIHKYTKREKISPVLQTTLQKELEALQKIATMRPNFFKANIYTSIFLPEWQIENYNFAEMYSTYLENIFTLGYGIFINNPMFVFSQGIITPVKYPDSTKLSDLSGYEQERTKVINNTISFLNGKPAANALLYGDAGTGKSSTVKAIVNEFFTKGLRMIEIRKQDLLKIPDLIDLLSENPLKFILFIDDLSFSKYSEEIGSLKAILEGSVASKTHNVIIYTTSNRRHLINERFEDRQGTDIHLNETIQEQTSLSDRFGLSVLFAKPNKDEYLEIVNYLITQYDVKINKADINILAERFAIERGGRSGRTARQFVENLKSKE